MKNGYKLLATTLFVSALLITGCTQQNSLSPDEKEEQTLQNEKELNISAKEVTEKNAILANEISLLESEVSALEKQIDETNLGAQRAKLVKEKAELQKKIEELKNEQIDNAKAFKASQQQKEGND